MYLSSAEKKQLFKEIPINNERLSKFNMLIKNVESFTQSEIVNQLNLNLAITDARNTNYHSYYFDLVHSNNTFEHVYPNVLKQILTEFARVTRKNGGVMSHFIDMSDHFAHFDKSITIYNFLQFSQSQWKWIDNRIQPLNRLRMPDYLKMYRELNIPVSDVDNRPGNVGEVESIKIDESFKKYSNNDLAISHSYIFSLL